ncbi:hypothetical protein [Cetobacterium sp. SF1]|uniref:hypothetical protein n=1 Tax=Cetobacterium sp. SF1 TaxID=3417654 RepID=UPI003CE6BBA0
MKNKLKLLAILTLAFSLFACEGKKEETPAPAATQTEQTTTPAPATATADNAAAVEAQTNPPAVVEDVTVIEEGTVAVPVEQVAPESTESSVDNAVDKGAEVIKSDVEKATTDVKTEAEKVKTDVKKDM